MNKTYSPNIVDLKKLPFELQVRFALHCAKSVQHLVNIKHKEIIDKTITTIWAYLECKATKEECRVAAAAAYAATTAAAAYAAAAAANAAANAATAAAAADAAAAYAATAAAAAAARDSYVERLIKEQWEVYEDLLNITDNLERAIGL